MTSVLKDIKENENNHYEPALIVNSKIKDNKITYQNNIKEYTMKLVFCEKKNTIKPHHNSPLTNLVPHVFI